MAEIGGGFGSFQEAVDYFRQKVNLPSQRWDDIRHGQHARAFIAAGVMRGDVLAEIRQAVDAAIAGGETLDDFRKRFQKIIGTHGWPGGAGNENDKRRAWRTSVIYHTNLRTAYMAGRWETLKHFPYLEYQHNTLENFRVDHKAWDGKIIATSDPWWQTHYPPNGWGCRCTATGVSEQALRARGAKPDAAPGASKGDPPPEWAYHVGEAASGRRVDPKTIEAERGGKMVGMDDRGPADFGRPAHIPVDSSPTAPLPASSSASELRAMSAQFEGAYTDPTGAVVEVTDEIVKHWLEDPKRGGREKYLPFLKEIIEDPYEIWVGFARNELTGKVLLRRRYVKAIDIGGGKFVSVVFDALGGKWLSFNAFFGNSLSKGQRAGWMLWGR